MANTRRTGRAAQKGFTLIELMVVVAIIGILSAVAMPYYGNYTSRTKATISISELDQYKMAVGLCAQNLGTTSGCTVGTNGIPTPGNTANTTFTGNLIKDGVITANSTATTSGGAAMGIIATATLSGSVLTWTTSGTICDGSRGMPAGMGGC